MRRVDRKIRFGFTMVEILMTLSILLIFFGFSNEVFRSTVLLSSASQNLCDDASRTDFALRLLRGDVWNCRSMTLADPRSLELSFSDGTKVSWKIDSRNSVVRTDAAGHDERWDDVGIRWTFSTDKVSLAISDGSSVPTRLVSQILLAQSQQQ
jgi:prepilin-type N-terminal cleavage/methylation domain-containing protein